MATADKIGFRASDEFQQRVEDYADSHGHENRTDALKELVDVGLREQQSPMLYRAKDRVAEWVNLLSFAAVLMFVISATTRIVAVTDGIIASFFMLALACVLLAGFELLRTFDGANGLGQQARAAVAMVVNR